MALPNFLKKDKTSSKKTKNKKDGKAQKADFREKCLALLEQIKEINEERYNELLNTFRSRYDKMNIQKKKILGFYGQLKNELATLKDQAGIEIKKTTQKVVNHSRVLQSAREKIEEKIDKETKKVKEVVKTVKKTTKKVATSLATKKKEKAAAEGTAKKKTKKTAKKTAKKAAKKTAKKTAKKKTAKKATAAKKTKSATSSAKKKKTVKKKTAKKKKS